MTHLLLCFEPISWAHSHGRAQIVPTEPSGAVTRAGLEAAAGRAREAGRHVAGVLYTSPCKDVWQQNPNPHRLRGPQGTNLPVGISGNPRGTLHSRAETAVVERFVVDNNLHLVWDAVYAGTVFDEDAAAAGAPVLPPEHLGKLSTIWGLAKDCGLSGWKVGAVHSTNPRVIEALEPQMRFAGASRLAHAAALGLLADTDRTRCCLRQERSHPTLPSSTKGCRAGSNQCMSCCQGAVALEGRAKAGRGALLAAGISRQVLGPAPEAGPLDLIDFSGGGAAVDEERLWRRALELGVHVVRGQVRTSVCHCIRHCIRVSVT